MVKIFILIPLAYAISKIYKLEGFNDDEKEVSK
jgi:hypothetical protein